MFDENILKVAGGIGLFIYSLKIVSEALDKSSTEAIRAVLDRVFSYSWLCMAIGIATAIVFQASSTVILIAMGLLNKSLLSMRQATLIMLGAAIGTTLKLDGGWEYSHLLGAILILFSSIGLLVNWQRSRLRSLEISLGIGFTILGLELVSSGLQPLLEAPAILHLLASCKGNTFMQALLAALCGAIGAALVQSSSSIVVITIGLTAKGLIPIEGASAIILGANIGTTSTGILLSIGQSIAAKRLAFMHFASKTIGVFIAILFFKSFLSFVFLIAPQGYQSMSMQVAMVHTIFNVCNSLLWWALLPVLLRLGRIAVPEAYDSEYWLSSLGVQKLLAKIPERATQEAQKELQGIVWGLSDITQSSLKLLVDSGLDLKKRETILKALPNGISISERRLKNVKDVVSRVASNWNEKDALDPRLCLILERVYKLGRLTASLKDLVNTINLSNTIPKITSREEVREVINQLANDIQLNWDRFYQSLSDGQSDMPAAVPKGDFIFRSFLKGQDFKSGIQMEKLYSVLFSLHRELRSTDDVFAVAEETPLPRSREREIFPRKNRERDARTTTRMPHEIPA